MRRALVVVAVLGALGYAAVRLVDRVTTEHYGDPATPEGYCKRYVDHSLAVVFDRERSRGFGSGHALLKGRVRNGGDRALRDVIVTVRHRVDPQAEPVETVVHLGAFAPGEERTCNHPVTVVTLPADRPRDGVTLFYDLTLERVVFAPSPGSRAPRP